MESRTIENVQNLIEDRNINRNKFRSNFPLNEVIEANLVYKKLAEEGCEYYFNYLELLDLSKDPNLVVLSSSHHYYYDAEDMKNVKTLVNLKPLNYIKQIKNFLHTIHHILPQRTYFVGSYVDGKNSIGFFSGSNKRQYQIAGKVDPVENGIASRIPFLNMIYDIMDSRTNRYLTKKAVTIMLEEAGLKVLDMTELNGLTYFTAQKVRSFEV